jgi:type VI secretion system protein ImpK
MATYDDPFASPDPDRTIIKPTPGGRTAAPVPPPRPVSFPEVPAGAPEPLAATSGLNPLVAAANPLLNLVPQLRNTAQHPDPRGLRDQLVRQLRDFEARARQAGVPSEKVIAARYALCTLLDEAVATAPWGGSGTWAQSSLLVTFHNESWGGEKFFQLLAKLAEDPAGNLDLLELLYVCLALGFEGRYRVSENGRAQLDSVRERLAQLLKRQKAEYERDLAPHWQAAAVQRHPVLAVLPLWVVFAACGLVLLGTYLWLSYSLNRISDPVFAQIYAVRPKAAPARVVVAPAPAPKPRLAQFLADEIREGLVALRDEEAQSVVTIRGDSLFAPGSANIAPAYEPTLMRVAKAIAAVPGQVLVTGHTDNTPIRTARFPSNWHLSEERARTVRDLMVASGVPADRVRAEGRAEGEPVRPNDSDANRALNRRVEITVLTARPDARPRTAVPAAPPAASR